MKTTSPNSGTSTNTSETTATSTDNPKFSAWKEFGRKWEGKIQGILTHKNDLGGATNGGVTLVAWKGLAPLFVPEADPGRRGLAAMTEEQFDRLAKGGFWNAVLAEQIESEGAAVALTDFAFHSGPVTAVRITQRALNKAGATLVEDGVMGPRTLAALNAAEKPAELIIDARAAFLEAVISSNMAKYKATGNPRYNQEVNRRGWFNRLNDLRQYVKKLS